MSASTKKALLHIAFAAFIVAAFGLAGSDDYAEAKAQEAYICQHHKPAPEFCRHVE